MTIEIAPGHSSKVTPRVVEDLIAILGRDNVLHRQDETLVYECDGYMVERSVPDLVVFPTSTEHVVEVVKLCVWHDLPFVPRARARAWPGARSRSAGV